MLKFVGTPQAMPDKRCRRPESGAATSDEIYANYMRARRPPNSRRAARKLRRAVAVHVKRSIARCAQQHPGLAEAFLHRRRLRLLLRRPTSLSSATNNFPEILRPHLPAGPGCAKATASSRKASRRGHHRLGREVHHRHRLVPRLGEADPAQARAARERRHRGRRSRRPRRRRAAPPQGLDQVAIYDRYDRVGRPGCRSTAFPTSSSRKEIVQRREKLLR